VVFEAPHEPVARELVDIYPGVRRDLEKIFGWDLDLTPTVLLFRESREFQRAAASPLTVAFAVPERNIVAIDYSRMSTRPFSLRNIFKHELCHLLLHRHIKKVPIPRWLDEGVAQWVSEGVGDIIWDQQRSLLNRAALSGRFIPLRTLARGFPRDGQGLILAYEESRSFVDHIISRFGRDSLIEILERMKGGARVDSAVLGSCSVSLREMEKGWHSALKRRTGWFTFLSYNLYEILFTLGGLLTIYAAVRLIIRKRRIMRDQMEDWS